VEQEEEEKVEKFLRQMFSIKSSRAFGLLLLTFTSLLFLLLLLMMIFRVELEDLLQNSA
jgi:flagellar biosynthesis/type III secretory pathway M-ring protein FliF/YscJ